MRPFDYAAESHDAYPRFVAGYSPVPVLFPGQSRVDAAFCAAAAALDSPLLSDHDALEDARAAMHEYVDNERLSTAAGYPRPERDPASDAPRSLEVLCEVLVLLAQPAERARPAAQARLQRYLDATPAAHTDPHAPHAPRVAGVSPGPLLRLITGRPSRGETAYGHAARLLEAGAAPAGPHESPHREFHRPRRHFGSGVPGR